MEERRALLKETQDLEALNERHKLRLAELQFERKKLELQTELIRPAEVEKERMEMIAKTKCKQVSKYY